MVFNTSFPLLTAPYISRVLGAENLGVVNYSYSIVVMFAIFGAFGIPVYGMREISRVKDQDEINLIVSKLFKFSIIMSLALIPIYLFISLNFFDKQTMYSLLIMTVIIIFTPFSFEWFFIGKENFRIVTIRSVFVKIVAFIIMLIFIKNSSHYLIYSGILAFSQVSTYLVTFFASKKLWKKVHVKMKEVKKLLIHLLPFFLTLLIASLFTVFDKILVGIFLDKTSVALYFRNRQITMLAIGLTTALVRVLAPRLSSLYKTDKDEYLKVLKFSFNFLILFTVPAIFGFISLGSDILYIFGGDEFVGGYSSFILLSFWMIFASLNVFLDNQIGIPNNKEKITTITTIIVAISLITLSSFFTPRYGIVGSSFALLSAEALGFIYQFSYYKMKGFIKFKIFDDSFIKVFIASVIMFLTIEQVSIYISTYLMIKVISLMILGIIVYFIALLIIRHEVWKQLIEVSKLLLRRNK